ncbi:hypothetical protein D3C76_1517320 [compost metagenome]
MAALQCRTHQLHVADALEGVIHAALSEIDDDFLNWFVMLFWIYEVRRAQRHCNLAFSGIDIDCDNAACVGHLCANDGGQTNTP